MSWLENRWPQISGRTFSLVISGESLIDCFSNIKIIWTEHVLGNLVWQQSDRWIEEGGTQRAVIRLLQEHRKEVMRVTENHVGRIERIGKYYVVGSGGGKKWD